jgi:hypothetical protein
MATMPIPAPAADPGSGPGPGGGFVSPAPAVEDPRAANALKASLIIVASARSLAEQFPAVTPEVRQINDLVQRMQMKIKAGQQPAETQAPPI